MVRLKKKKWSDYMWLVSATYFTLGLFNIVFAWLGVICFMIPLLMAVFGGGKGYYHFLPSENMVCILSDGQYDSTHLQVQGKISLELGRFK